MNTNYTHRFVLRATIEFTSPFHIGTGWAGDIADAIFVTDANGLPAIPGSSLAGVLRKAFRSVHNDRAVENQIFGFQQGNQGQGSRLNVSWACIHDQHNCPVEGIISPQRLDDPVLACARNPLLRDHVRINHKGASDSAELGKFDEQAVCAGHRFTFEVELIGNEDDLAAWEQLLALFGDPSLRLGGKTRRGFGAFKIIHLKSRIFDLRCDFEAYRAHPTSLAQLSPELNDVALISVTGKSTLKFTLCLKPKGYWMFGGGTDLPDDPGEADIVPVRDSRIVWNNDHGIVEKDIIIIPASGFKGALAHRVAFHYNALTGVFADNIESQADVTGENNAAVRELFGYTKGHKTKDGTNEEGQRGRVIFDDIYLTQTQVSQLVHHVGIDRFTGGARDQVLFSERPLWGGEDLFFTLYIAEPNTTKDAWIKRAFSRALKDLVQGRLQIGSGNGRGEGYFLGNIDWSPEASSWLSEDSDSSISKS